MRRVDTDLSLLERAAWASQVFVLLLGVWFALNGFSLFVVGLLAAAAGGALAGALATERAYAIGPVRLAAFLTFFLLSSLRGGLDVAWRAIQPSLPIQPALLRIRHGLPAGQPRTLFVSVLSLLPGTLSADLVEGGETLIVHVLTDEAGASVEELRDRIRRLFALPHESA
jgi:multicomponent Na+:H+ antiporter subunit E